MSETAKGIIIWAFLIGIVAVLYVRKLQNKKKYKGVDMAVTGNWYETSQEMYDRDDDTVRQYYFHFDKHYEAQGHIMEDIDHNVAYEAYFLYNNVDKPDEVDLTNHVIDYKHHHKVGHTATRYIGAMDISMAIKSSFTFDGVGIWDYLESLGYSMDFKLRGLAFEVDVLKDGELAAKLYSSNNGKNLYEADGPVESKMGAKGSIVIECRDRDLDAAFLYAMAYTRCELAANNM